MNYALRAKLQTKSHDFVTLLTHQKSSIFDAHETFGFVLSFGGRFATLLAMLGGEQAKAKENFI